MRPGPRGQIDGAEPAGCERGAPGEGHHGRGRGGCPLPDRRAPGARPARGRAEGGQAEAVLRARSCGLISSAERGPPTVCQAGDTNRASLDTRLRTSKPVYSGRDPGKEGSQGADPLSQRAHRGTLMMALPFYSVHSASSLGAAACLVHRTPRSISSPMSAHLSTLGLA